MDRDERLRLRDASRRIALWAVEARRVVAWREAAEDAVRRQLAELESRTVVVAQRGEPAWRVTPLTRDQAEALLRALVDRANLPEADSRELRLVRDLAESRPLLKRAQRLTTWRRIFTRRNRYAEALDAAHRLLDLFDRGRTAELTGTLPRLGRPTDEVDPRTLGIDDLTDPRLGLTATALLDPGTFGELPRALADLDAAGREEAPHRQRVLDLVEAMRAPRVRSALEAMPLETLKEASVEPLRLGPPAAAGMTSVQSVLDRQRELRRLDGIGPASRDAILAAAETLRRMAAEDTVVDLSEESTALVAALAAWDGARRTHGAAEELALTDSLRPLAALLTDDVVRALVEPLGGRRVQELVDVVGTVLRRADVVATTTPRGRIADPQADFESRPADYYVMLGELGFLTEDEEASHGDLPPGLVETVRATALRTEHLRVTLRGYQAFAARFALVQRRVVIGDEMGLGKTIEALAVLAHLWSTGATHFVVVCPPGVVTNWVREIEARSTLDAHRVHGSSWADAAAEWERDGGVAVTTYDTDWMERRGWQQAPVACAVVDEAHYVKNPETKRARRTTALLAQVDRALLLTGTPMENHVGEFATLIGYVQPHLLLSGPLPPGVEVRGRPRPSLETTGPTALPPRLFRKQVAPAYLRRNQEDVLSELPGLVEVEEWLPMGPRDLSAYRKGVADGNLMQMRKAAMQHRLASPKVRRLVELVEEAEDNGRRVIVYSFFREVLAELVDVLPGPVFGPLDGSVAPAARQRMVDDFSAAPGGAVLVAQVTTGGIGLNIQAASVVILCEPQLKPTTEEQAIARAHRMGQLRSVQVHRLLTEDSVDERIRELLAEKRRLFDDYARESSLVDAAPEAVDVEELTEAEVARRVLAAERERLLYEPPTVIAPDV